MASDWSEGNIPTNQRCRIPTVSTVNLNRHWEFHGDSTCLKLSLSLTFRDFGLPDQVLRLREVVFLKDISVMSLSGSLSGSSSGSSPWRRKRALLDNLLSFRSAKKAKQSEVSVSPPSVS